MNKREEIVKQIQSKEISLTRAATKLKVSRQTLYNWLKKTDPTDATSKPRSVWYTKQALLPVVEKKILACVKQNPQVGLRDLYKRIQNHVSYHGFLNCLKRNGLDDAQARKIFSISPDDLPILFRKRMVEKVSLGHYPVSQVAAEYGLSRTMLYEWIKRCQTYGWQSLQKTARVYSISISTPASLIQNVLDRVIRNPQLSYDKLYQQLKNDNANLSLGRHGIYNILKKYNLNQLNDRLIYAAKFQPLLPERKPAQGIDSVSLPTFDELSPNVLPGPPPPLGAEFLAKEPAFEFEIPQIPLQFPQPVKHLISTKIAFLGTTLLSFALISLYLNLVNSFLSASSVADFIGLLFASVALLFGTFFFLYSIKYYLTIGLVLLFSRNLEGDQKNIAHKGSAIGMIPDLSQVVLTRKPFISIHVPIYNEKRVVNRLLEAVTSLEYENYEVIVCDDSTDETRDILLDWKNHPKVKISHRDSRQGFKGGALREAQKLMNPATEFVMVFDADFLPYPDSVEQFLKYFQISFGSLDPQVYSRSNIAVIQGYQWHVLNKSENWITRGVRTEYSGSYVLERSGNEIYGGLKQIAGSVFMMRADVLRHFGWETSITEDFQLTLRLYQAGYKVIYSPYIQAPSECVSTLKRLVRQRMRWAEGHSHNIKKLFKNVLNSDKTTFFEKFEFLYLSPYYLQSFFFLIGTFCWFVSEVVFQIRLPFWTAVWGWSLVLTNMLSLPLMNLVGLFLEEAEEKDYAGLFSFLALTYILAPFQAYASVKGFMEKEEGPWFRTPKTGKITDTYQRSRFYSWFKGLFGKPGLADPQLNSNSYKRMILNYQNVQDEFDLTTTQTGRPRSKRFVSRALLTVTILVTFITNQLITIEYSGSTQHTNSTTALTAQKTQFAAWEKPEFRLSRKSNNANTSVFTGFIRDLVTPEVVRAEISDNAIIAASVSYRGSPVDVETHIRENEQEYAITIDRPQLLKPGKYTLTATLSKDGDQETFKQDFSWGVLAINTQKSIYAPGEIIKFGFGVVDDAGNTICDAKLKLEIVVPSQAKTYELSTVNEKIQQSGECSRDSVTNKADYLAEFVALGQEETYQLHLEAISYNGKKAIDDQVILKKNVPFEIERFDYPTRIYPKASYPVKIKVTAQVDFTGEIVETLPHRQFFAENVSDGGIFSQFDPEAATVTEQTIRWNMEFKKGQTNELSYLLSFPLLSPQFYEIGPLVLVESGKGEAEREVFREARAWQVAADAIAFVQGPTAASCVNVTTCTRAFASNNTAGNLIIVAMRIGGTGSFVTSVTDTNANTYQVAVGPITSGANGYIYYAENIATGANTVTVNIDVATNYRVAINEYSGLATSNALDKTSSNNNTTTTAHNAGTTATTTNANELLFAAFAHGSGGGTLTKDAAYTTRQSSSSFLLTEDRIVSATGAYTATMTTSTNSSSAGMLATFSDTAIPENWQILALLSPLLIWQLRRLRKKKRHLITEKKSALGKQDGF